MGTFINSSRIGSDAEFWIFPRGLDLTLCQIREAYGHWLAASSATFRAGQFVALNSSGEVVVSDGDSILGVAKFNKTTAPIAIAVDEAVVFPTAGSTVTLAHANTSDTVVFSAVEQGGARYTVTTDYTLNTTNGTITQVALGSIVVGATVYVSYSYALTAAQINQDGRNFWNDTDDVSIQNRRITVIQGSPKLFTTEFVKVGRTYTLTGLGANLYVNSSGILTNDSAAGRFVGRVIQLPAASYPFMGVQLNLSAIAETS
jgi:hypothetical protein